MRHPFAAGLCLLLSFSTRFSPPAHAASVIDREAIERYHFTSVARAIETLAGIDVVRTYFKQNVVTARGILEEHYANKILMMIDGVPAWNAITGEPIIDRIRIEDVERIEVTKGPASVEYGTNAYAAAINIVLRKEAAGSYAMHLRAGTESTTDAGGHVTIGNEALQVFVAANDRGDEGQTRSFIDEKGRRDAYREYQRGQDVTLTVRSQRHTLLLNAVWEAESFLGNTPDLAAGLGSDHRSRGLLAAYDYTLPVGASSIRYRASYDDSSRNFARTGDGLVRSNVDGWRLTNILSGRWTVDPSLTLDGGIESELRKSVQYTNYDVRSGRTLEDNDMRGRSSNDWSLFGRANEQFGPWRVSAGARYVNSSIVRSNLSADGRADYTLDPRNSVALLAGQSYREPSLFELYFHTSSNTVYGNTALLPETSTAYQFVYTHRDGPVEMQATLYHASYDHKIFRTRRLPDDPVDRSLVYVNGDRFSANGLELEGHWTTAQGASFFATYAFVKGTRGDALPGTEHYNFRYVPQHALSAGAAHAAGPWSLAAVGTWRSGTHGPLSGIDARSSVDLDLGYTQELGRVRMRHALVVSNAFDSEGEIPEYVRRNLNSVPAGIGRRIGYMLRLQPFRRPIP
jgi:outer membrane receptor protein involved in Fe transport